MAVARSRNRRSRLFRRMSVRGIPCDREDVVTNPFPDWLVPMAATLTQDRFVGPEWIFERKFDGIRLLAFKQ